MTQSKRLSIILLSYNDPRIADAINSVRRFDDVATVRLVLVDGGSKQEIRDLIQPLLSSDDVFVCERDKGIFDALNKGLERCTTEFIGWLGSDDAFTCQVRASDVVRSLQSYDLLVAGTALVRGNEVRRVSHALPSRLGLVKYGLNNPHFSTFGRARLLKSERFEVGMLGADIAYFLRIFDQKPTVETRSAIATLMNEGGFSTKSYVSALRVNLGLMSVYRKSTNFAVAPIAIIIKLTYKACSTLYYKIFRLDRSSLEHGIS
jgi:glycosyltransferase involved in cell wall biosynthesis